MSQSAQTDGALRAMTDDGAFRVVVIRTTDTVRRMLAAQKLGGETAKKLGELATAAILVRETMAPDYRLQALVHDLHQGRLVVDTHPDGGTRGLVTRKDPSQELSLEGATLEIVRTLYSGDVHRGVVAVPSGAGMSEALMSYLQGSEQVESMLSVACVLGEGDEDGELITAGGYLVQLLPEVGRAPLAIMAERLSEFRDIGPVLVRSDAALEPLLGELLYGMPFSTLERRPVSWQCRCSDLRVMSSLATLPRRDLEELIAAKNVIELSCDFCGATYNISPSQLSGLLDES